MGVLSSLLRGGLFRGQHRRGAVHAAQTLKPRLQHWLNRGLLAGVIAASTFSAATHAQAPSWRAQRGHLSPECADMDCRASLAVTNPVVASAAQPSIPAVTDSVVASAARQSKDAKNFKDLLPQAQLLGQSRLTVWGFKIYDAQLWAAPGFNPDRYASQPLALELAYLRDFDAADIAERSLKEMRRSATISDTQARQWRSAMQRVFPNVKAGDRILGVHRPGIGASFWVNGQAGGEILDAEFSKLFFGIWLSPQTSEPAMRNALVGGANS